MPYYIVSFQEENWQDDGGDHDPVLLELSAEDWKELMEIDLLSTYDDFYLKVMESKVEPSVLPAVVSGYGTVWTSW